VKIHPNALIDYKKLKDKKLKSQIDKLTVGYENKTEFYVEKLKFGIATIAAAFYPYEVVLRFSDFKSNEYRNLIGGDIYEPEEENPMLGWRGASRYYDENFTKAFALECEAVREVRENLGLWNLKVMIPFCRTPEEGRKVIALMEKYGLKRKSKKTEYEKVKVDRDNFKETVQIKSDLEIYVMAEIPSNVLQAEEFADIFDAFSIGSNDLTQLTLGLDRDSKLIAHIGSERNHSVRKLISELIKVAHRKGKKVGICGQGPSDFPDFAEFLVREGIDSISINPDTVLKASLRIKEVEKTLKRKRGKNLTK
jgi:pyruvate,water dikinase